MIRICIVEYCRYVMMCDDICPIEFPFIFNCQEAKMLSAKPDLKTWAWKKSSHRLSNHGIEALGGPVCFVKMLEERLGGIANLLALLHQTLSFTQPGTT